MPTRHAKPTNLAIDILAVIAYTAWELLDDLSGWLTDQLDRARAWLTSLPTRMRAWNADQKPDERAYQAVRLLIAVLVVGGLIVALTSCRGTDTAPTVEKTAVNTSAVKVVQP